MGGAQRIVKFSEMIVPLKVGLFFLSATFILIYHYASIIPALKLILKSGLSWKAVAGGAAGSLPSSKQCATASCDQLMPPNRGWVRPQSFLATRQCYPVRDGIMAMATSLVSALVCFAPYLCASWQAAYGIG